MRRSQALVSLAAAATLLIAGCGNDPANPADGGGDWSIPDEPPTATIQVLGHQDDDDQTLGPVFDAFSERYPTITVQYESVPFDQLNSILDARISNQDGNPDVYWADQPRVPALASRGYMEPLTEAFADAAGSWDEAPTESSSYDGELWSVPIANSTQLLYYNRELLEQAGIEDPSSAIEDRLTWEELTDLAQQAIDGGAPNGLLLGQPDRYYQMQPLPMSLGGSVGAAGEGNLTPEVTGEPWIEAMEWYRDVHADGLMPRGLNGEQTSPEFLAGTTAFFVQGPWLLTQLAETDLDWGVAPHPYFEGGEPITPTGSWSLAMSPFSDEKEAAAIFMHWMSTENGGGYTQNLLGPELPATPEGKDAYFARDVFQSEDGAAAVEIIDFETQNTAVPRVQTIGFVEFEEILGRAFSDVKNGAEPDTALQTAQEEIETAWARYR